MERDKHAKLHTLSHFGTYCKRKKRSMTWENLGGLTQGEPQDPTAPMRKERTKGIGGVDRDAGGLGPGGVCRFVYGWVVCCPT